MLSPYSALSLVRQRIHALRQSTERKNFMFFYVERWITDPEVDSRLSEHVLCPLVSDSHLFGVSPSDMQCSWFDSGYMYGVSLRGSGEFHIFST